MTYVKIKNRSDFGTITTAIDSWPVPTTDWQVCYYDVDGEPWSWFRLATPQEVEEWLEAGHQLGDWIEL